MGKQRSKDQKAEIIKFKQIYGIKMTSKLLSIPYTSVRDTKTINRKRKYGNMETNIIQYIQSYVINTDQYKIQDNNKQQQTLIRRIIQQQLNYETSDFKQFIRQKDKNINRKRIYTNIKQIIFPQLFGESQQNRDIIKDQSIQQSDHNETIQQNQNSKKFGQINEQHVFQNLDEKEWKNDYLYQTQNIMEENNNQIQYNHNENQSNYQTSTILQNLQQIELYESDQQYSENNRFNIFQQYEQQKFVEIEEFKLYQEEDFLYFY